MTVAYDSTTQTITLTSTNLTDFTNIDTVTLTSTINCCTTTFTVEILETDVNLPTGEYVIDNTTFYGSASLADGIYSFDLNITYTAGNGDPINEKACLFIDDSLKCDIKDIVSSSPNLQAQMDYFVLKQTQDCPCQCDSLCVIYERMMESLGLDCDVCTDNDEPCATC